MKIIIIILTNLLLFGCSESNHTEFDSTKAFALLKAQCEIGYRIPDTPEHEKGKQHIISELKKLSIKTELQEFTAYSSLLKKDIKLTNIFAIIGTIDENTTAVSAHWDTRPIAEKDNNIENRNKPILGANDGASGVAVLLELARVLKIKESEGKLKSPVILIFLDGEDLGLPNTAKEFCLGSKYLSYHIPEGIHISKGINIDMIGDADLILYKEGNSHRDKKTSIIQDEIWEIGEKLYPSVFKNEVKYAILDDHLSFIEKGIPYTDIIDFDYKYWHTTQDTPDKCSPESLQIIGDVLVKYLCK